MNRLQTLWTRYGTALVQFLKFGLIGGAGVLVNQGVFVAANVFMRDVFGVGSNEPFLNLFGTQYHIRFFHVFSVVAFLVANMFNFILNRYWTFRASARAPFLREYAPFLLVGSAATVVGLMILTWLMKSDWPLSNAFFDGSTGLRTKVYWANLIQIALVMPVNFVFNKLWTFQSVRKRHAEAAELQSKVTEDV